MGENKKWISLKRRLGKKVEGGDIVQKENLFLVNLVNVIKESSSLKNYISFIIF
jgi:hypothetical protein